MASPFMAGFEPAPSTLHRERGQMGVKDDRVLLKHILDEINFIISETDGMEFVHFMNNEVLKRACSRSLEIIG